MPGGEKAVGFNPRLIELSREPARGIKAVWIQQMKVCVDHDDLKFVSFRLWAGSELAQAPPPGGNAPNKCLILDA
jgi:hypothetical protein